MIIALPKNTLQLSQRRSNSDPYKTACNVLGITPEPELTDMSNRDKVKADAMLRLIVCIRAKNLLNGKVWVAKHDGSENHHWPVLYKKYHYGVWKWFFSKVQSSQNNCRSTVGPDLEYRTEQLAKEGAIEFEKYYSAYYGNLQS